MMPERRRRWFWVWLVVTLIGLACVAAGWSGLTWNERRVPTALSVAMWCGWLPLLLLPVFLVGRSRVPMMFVMVVLAVPAVFFSFFALMFGRPPRVVLEDSPIGQPGLVIGSSGFFFSSCFRTFRTVAAGLLLQPLGDSYCSSGHDGDYLPFAERSARFERYPERGLIAFVADSTQGGGDGKLYLEHYRTTGSLVVPVTVGGASHTADRDRAIREQLDADAAP